MTEQQTEPAPVQVRAEPGSRLEQLQQCCAVLKADAAESAAKLKACVDALKFEMTTAVPDTARKVQLAAGAHNAPPLDLIYTEPWQFDMDKFKLENPAIYVRYAHKKPGGTWTLRVGKADTP